ncbi:hypothetical protein Cantr_01255 [Candida viswanathii]|uniref:Uncharacterized protein n=1 Tax=Candida viswanathii TaxID=5486 RepID=A0A367YIK4_9ASCO|nr:hypothetical protein Cantr_01255 [Candida viswanathii]
MLRVTDSDALPKKFQLPGWEISSISAPMRNHVGKFRHYQVNLSLTKIERMVVKLNQALAYLNEIFVAPHGADFKTVKLFIQLNYSLSTFGLVKDCLANVDQLSKYFNRSGKNIVTIDLDLNCREDG